MRLYSLAHHFEQPRYRTLFSLVKIGAGVVVDEGGPLLYGRNANERRFKGERLPTIQWRLRSEVSVAVSDDSHLREASDSNFQSPWHHVIMISPSISLVRQPGQAD